MEFYTSILRCASGDGEQIAATKIVTRDSIGIIKNKILVSVKKVLTAKIAIFTVIEKIFLTYEMWHVNFSFYEDDSWLFLLSYDLYHTYV